MADPRPQLLYLLTDEISSVLVRGQLGFLVGDGFDVTVACRRAEPARPPEAGRWDDGVRVEHLPFVREPSPVADLRALWATVRLVRRVRPDVVNASTPKAGLLGSVAAWLCRVPVRVYVVRGLRLETASGWRRRLFGVLERVAMRCANHVVFNSASLMAAAETEGLIAPGRGEVVGGGSGNGIDVGRFADDVLPTREAARRELGLPDDAAVVGFVGRFTRDKGIADLVDAVTTSLPSRTRDQLRMRDSPRTREQFAALEAHEITRSPEGGALWLLLVGQFEEGDPVGEATRRAIETHERIVVVPWMQHTGVAYRAMDVLAFPSYREGLPNVPLEAQLCGVPVVGYGATGTVDAVADGETGLLVPVGATEQFAEAVLGLLADGERRAELGAAAPGWVAARFDRQTLWTGWAERYRRWVGIDPPWSPAH